MTKTALVISGGGSKGAFAVGAVKHLLEEGFEFDLVVGTSTGALIAPMVAIGDIEILEKIYTSVENKDILRHNWRKLYWNALFDTKPLEDLVRDALSVEDRYNRVLESSTSVLLCAVNLQTEATTYFTQHDNIENTVKIDSLDEMVSAVLASTNQPVFTPAISFRGNQYVDGGVREIIPLRVAIEAGCDRVVVISNSPGTPDITDKQLKNIASIGIRTLGVMSTETAGNDIEQLEHNNDVLKYIEEAKERATKFMTQYQIDNVFCGGEQFGKAVELTIIKPEQPLDMDGLSFNPEKMTIALHQGYERAKKVLNM